MEEESDWEYFYEDAEMKPDENNDKVEATPEIKQEDEIEAAKPFVGKTQRVNPKDGWECPTCTLLNEPTRPGCEACTTERPKDYVQPPLGPADTLYKGATAKPEPSTSKAPPPTNTATKEKDDILKNYKKLDDLDLIPNAEPFECIICYLDIEPGDGVVLRECLHTFCK